MVGICNGQRSLVHFAINLLPFQSVKHKHALSCGTVPASLEGELGRITAVAPERSEWPRCQLCSGTQQIPKVDVFMRHLEETLPKNVQLGTWYQVHVELLCNQDGKQNNSACAPHFLLVWFTLSLGKYHRNSNHLLGELDYVHYHTSRCIIDHFHNIWFMNEQAGRGHH